MNQTPSLPPAGSHFIPLARGIEMTTLFRANRETVLAPAFQNQDILPVCETFNRFDIDTLLAKQNCQALRVYLGMDESLRVRMLLVAVNGNAEDMLPLPSRQAPAMSSDEKDIVEEGHRCPPVCPPASPLNT
jgi:hypothetical protein